MGEQTSLTIISLSTLLNSKEVDKDTIQCALSSFCPVKDHEDIYNFGKLFDKIMFQLLFSQNTH